MRSNGAVRSSRQSAGAVAPQPLSLTRRQDHRFPGWEPCQAGSSLVRCCFATTSLCAGGGIIKVLKLCFLGLLALVAATQSVSAEPVIVSNLSAWDGASRTGNFGASGFSTWGQTVLAPAGTQRLVDFTFMISDAIQGTSRGEVPVPVEFHAYVAEFNPVTRRIIGPLLYTSEQVTVPVTDGWEFNPYTFTPDIPVTAGATYLLFLFTDNYELGLPSDSRAGSRRGCQFHLSGRRLGVCRHQRQRVLVRRARSDLVRGAWRFRRSRIFRDVRHDRRRAGTRLDRDPRGRTRGARLRAAPDALKPPTSAPRARHARARAGAGRRHSRAARRTGGSAPG
jgi:hypothetical protein